MAMPRDREKLAETPETAVSLDSRLLEKVDAAFGEAARLAAEAVAALGPETDVADRFEAALSAVLVAAAAQPDLTRLCLVEAPGLGVQAVERKEAGLQRFVDLLDRELAAAGGGESPPLVAELVVGGVYEVVQRAARAGDYAAMPELAGQLRQLWVPALRGL
jgi:hypothetical protein